MAGQTEFLQAIQELERLGETNGNQLSMEEINSYFSDMKLEDKQLIIDRIHDAAKYIPLDRLYLSPQCGFASCEIGNKLTEEEQWAKLKLVKEIAEEVWN